jgi:hypothetical protein
VSAPAATPAPLLVLEGCEFRAGKPRGIPPPGAPTDLGELRNPSGALTLWAWALGRALSISWTGAAVIDQPTFGTGCKGRDGDGCESRGGDAGDGCGAPSTIRGARATGCDRARQVSGAEPP